MRSIIVLPTYNEVGNISPFLTALREASSDIEVLVVDDASPDGTADEARRCGAAAGGVRVLERPSKDGLGSAYRAGFAQVLAEGYDVVVSMDADLSHDPAVIPVMLDLIEDGADAVIGSRYVDGGGTENWPLHRRLLSRWGNRYTRAVLRLPINDCTTGFRAYRASALAALRPAETEAEGYAFLTELVRRLTHDGAVVVETPIVFRDRRYGKSKMSARIVVESMFRVTWWAARDAFGRRRDGA